MGLTSIELRFKRWSRLRGDGIHCCGFSPADGPYAKYEIERSMGLYGGRLTIWVREGKGVFYTIPDTLGSWQEALSVLVARAEEDGAEIPGLVSTAGGE